MDTENTMNQSPLTAYVEFEIRKDNTTAEQWVARWAERALDAWHHEPETLSYEAMISLEDNSRILIFERYANGMTSIQAHMARPSHKGLESAMGEARMTRRLVRSVAAADIPGYGWWSRSDRPRQTDGRTIGGARVAVFGSRFGDTAKREAFVELSGEHAKYCWDAEPDTLTYSGGLATPEGSRAEKVEPGDLVFLMEATDEAAMTKHAEDPVHVALGPVMAERGVDMKLTFQGYYQTTGAGFMCR